MKKMIISFLAIGTLMASCSSNEAETKDAKDVVVVKTETTKEYNVVKEGSVVSWRGSHIGGLKPHNGTINLDGANISVTDGKITNAKIDIDMKSLVNLDVADSTWKLKLENHLKNADFFNVETYSTTTFEITGVEKAEGDFNSKIIGNLTLMDSTKSISFDANVTISEEEVNITSSDFSINRTKWGLIYKSEGTLGMKQDDIISNTIGFKFDVTVTK